MNRWVIAVSAIVAFAAVASGESCGDCRDEIGSACWTTHKKRNANCKNKGWEDKNYCSRSQDGCGFAYCHCCGSSMNSGCFPAKGSREGEGEAAFSNDKEGWKCFPTASERDSKCGSDYPKRCQGRRVFYAGRSGKNNTYRTRMTYCCSKTIWPAVC